MSNMWLTSDHHFHHANILKFTGADGELIRPGFENVDEMNEYMIDVWNSRINDGDRVYHLGDFSMRGSAEAISIADRLKGRKVLIKGNHDYAKLNIYARHFDDVRSETHKKTKDGDMVIFSHRPLLIPEYNGRYHIWNVHGHIHQNPAPTIFHVNVSVELTMYLPLTWEEIQSIIKTRKERIYGS